jgi:hypothetical protein
MRKLPPFFFAGFLACLSVSVWAAEEGIMHLPVPPELKRFVTLHTGIQLPDLKIIVVDNDTAFMQYEAQQGIVYQAAGAEHNGDIYLPVRSAVHLQEDGYRAVIVHELVHIAQEKSPRHYQCTGQREAEAYQIQNIYLLTHDLPAAVDGDRLNEMKLCETVATAAD